jgi:hypothetical protein
LGDSVIQLSSCLPCFLRAFKNMDFDIGKPSDVLEQMHQPA